MELARLKARLARLESRVGDAAQVRIFAGYRATVGNQLAIDHEPLARAARAKLLGLDTEDNPGGRVTAPTPEEYDVLVRVLAAWRPVVSTRAGEACALPADLADAFPGWDPFRTRVAPWLRSIARVQTWDSTAWSGVGTAFVVAPGLVATNFHVWQGIKEQAAYLAFAAEEDAGSIDSRAVTGVAGVDEASDLALLRFAGATPPALELADDRPVVGDDIAVIGHPCRDPRSPVGQKAVFGVFPAGAGYKRLAPGEVTAMDGPDVEHDASTLGGNSGSPVLRQRDARVVGVHSEGDMLLANRAVAVAALQALVAAA